MLSVISLCLTDSDDHSILKWNLLSDETTQVNTLHFGLIAPLLSYVSLQVCNFFTNDEFCLSFLITGH